MAVISFTKMQGAGNDFIMVDNRQGVISAEHKVDFVVRFCKRGLAVGADGVIFLENDSEFDAKWDFYNADGSSAEMCGNGARCFAVFANLCGACGEEMTFRTIAGPIKAKLSSQGRAEVKLTDAPLPVKHEALTVNGRTTDVYFINTGVPHALVAVDDIESVDIKKDGAAIRYHEQFAPAGTNANFISTGDKQVLIRTYERGVEDETLACGTGSVAAAIIAGECYDMQSPVAVLTRGGDILNISYKRSESGISEVYLEGPAVVVYRAELDF